MLYTTGSITKHESLHRVVRKRLLVQQDGIQKVLDLNATPTNDRWPIVAPLLGKYLGSIREATPIRQFSIAVALGTCPSSLNPATPICTFPFHGAQSKISMNRQRVLLPLTCRSQPDLLCPCQCYPERLSLIAATVWLSTTAVNQVQTNLISLLPRFPSAQDILHLSSSQATKSSGDVRDYPGYYLPFVGRDNDAVSLIVVKTCLASVGSAPCLRNNHARAHTMYSRCEKSWVSGT